MQIRNRNVEIRRVRAGDLAPNSLNWRVHPDSQKDALRGLLAEVGFVGTLLAYQPPGKPLTLIDGHLRSETSPDTEVDVCIVDLTEAEAAKVLACYDPLASMAEADAVKLDALMREVETDNAAVQELLTKLANANMPAATEPERATDKLDEQSQTLEEFIKARKASVARGYDKGELHFFVCLVFQSFEQKHEFLYAIRDIPVLYGSYADGQTLAQRLGIQVTPNAQREITSQLDKKLMALVESENLHPKELGHG